MSALRAAPVHSSMGVDLRARAEAGAQSTAAAGRRRARGRAELARGHVRSRCRSAGVRRLNSFEVWREVRSG
mgnify:CR=1 FL=1